jgi:hypothetical protein
MKAQAAVVKEGTVRQTLPIPTITNLLQITVIQVTEIMISITKVSYLPMSHLLSKHLMSKNLRGVVLRILLARNISLRSPSSLLSFLVCQSFSSKLLRITL